MAPKPIFEQEPQSSRLNHFARTEEPPHKPDVGAGKSVGLKVDTSVIISTTNTYLVQSPFVINSIQPNRGTIAQGGVFRRYRQHRREERRRGEGEVGWMGVPG